ncbi:hypothetical protein [Brachyspira hampsonii]|uniref:hypothetical protein n=1 Tax=Brachyspira hampsonii TaxID=1287055 RepID=UPI00034B0FD8|nr:hypothetical protein [Brachyspira hampsonii]
MRYLKINERMDGDLSNITEKMDSNIASLNNKVYDDINSIIEKYESLSKDFDTSLEVLKDSILDRNELLEMQSSRKRDSSLQK